MTWWIGEIRSCLPRVAPLRNATHIGTHAKLPKIFLNYTHDSKRWPRDYTTIITTATGIVSGSGESEGMTAYMAKPTMSPNGSVTGPTTKAGSRLFSNRPDQS